MKYTFAEKRLKKKIKRSPYFFVMNSYSRRPEEVYRVLDLNKEGKLWYSTFPLNLQDVKKYWVYSSEITLKELAEQKEKYVWAKPKEIGKILDKYSELYNGFKSLNYFISNGELYYVYEKNFDKEYSISFDELKMAKGYNLWDRTKQIFYYADLSSDRKRELERNSEEKATVLPLKNVKWLTDKEANDYMLRNIFEFILGDGVSNTIDQNLI